MGSMHTGLECHPERFEELGRFYAERATGGVGLIVTGGFAPNFAGRMKDEPGTFERADQIADHRKVTSAVHATGGRILLQILHAGRYGYHGAIVAPSAIQSPINRHTPKALTSEEIEETITRLTASFSGLLNAPPPARCRSSGCASSSKTTSRALDTRNWRKFMRGLKERVAIVTGAAGGIGQSICKRFVEEGMKLVAADVNAAALEELAKSLVAAGGEVLPLAFDITRYQDVEGAVAKAVAHFGKIDVLVNNAGWDIAKLFIETEPDLWDKIIAINLKGPLNLHKAVLPHLIAGGGGKVINIASDAGRVGSSGESVYAACKGGLIAFSKTVARECARDNVRVNVVCPGPTDTALLRSFVGEGEYGQKIYDKLQKAIPLKRLGQPDDIPGMIAFFASSDADFITGQVISVSGGLTMHG